MIVSVWTTTFYFPHKPSIVLSLDGTTISGLTYADVIKYHIQHIEVCSLYRNEISNQEKKISKRVAVRTRNCLEHLWAL